MAEGPIPNPVPTEKPSVTRELFRKCARLFWGAFGLESVADEIETHESAGKKARVIFILGGFCFVSALGGCWINSFSSGKKMEDIEGKLNAAVTQGASNSVALQIMQGLYQSNNAAIQQLNFDLLSARNERDNLSAKFAPFQAQALRVFTNDLPTEALNKLYKEITQVDAFEVYLNGVLLTNATGLMQRIDIGSVQPISLTVNNYSRFALKDLIAYFSLPLHGDSNVVADGWFQPGSAGPMWPGDTNRVILWRAQADAPISQMSIFQFPKISFKTNVWESPIEGETNYFLPLGVQVHSERSELKRFSVMVNYTPSAK